jgi:hypothetical protein
MDAVTTQLLAVKMIAEEARSAALIAKLLQSIADQGKVQAKPAQTDKVTISPQAIDLLKTNNRGLFFSQRQIS